MKLIDALKKLRDDLKLWATNNFKNILTKIARHEVDPNAHKKVLDSYVTKDDFNDHINNNILIYQNKKEFPSIGTQNRFYIAHSDRSMYYWYDGAYHCLNGEDDIWDFAILYGGNASEYYEDTEIFYLGNATESGYDDVVIYGGGA